MSNSDCRDFKCNLNRTNRTNLVELRKALGETDNTIRKPYNKKYSKDEEGKTVPCTVCNDIEASARNSVLRAIRQNLKTLHFDKTELSVLIRLYIELLGGDMRKELSIQEFKQFLTSSLGILEPFALDGISRAVRVANKFKTITLDEFLHGLSVLLRGNLNERIDFAFKVIDFDSDGFFRKNSEITSLLSGTFDPQVAALNPDLDPEEPERDTVNYLYQRLNSNNLSVSLEDFRSKVSEEPLLLECLIQFLPSPEKSMSFQEVLFPVVTTTDQWLPRKPSDPIRIKLN